MKKTINYLKGVDFSKGAYSKDLQPYNIDEEYNYETEQCEMYKPIE